MYSKFFFLHFTKMRKWKTFFSVRFIWIATSWDDYTQNKAFIMPSFCCYFILATGDELKRLEILHVLIKLLSPLISLSHRHYQIEIVLNYFAFKGLVERTRCHLILFHFKGNFSACHGRWKHFLLLGIPSFYSIWYFLLLPFILLFHRWKLHEASEKKVCYVYQYFISHIYMWKLTFVLLYFCNYVFPFSTFLRIFILLRI